MMMWMAMMKSAGEVVRYQPMVWWTTMMMTTMLLMMMMTMSVCVWPPRFVSYSIDYSSFLLHLLRRHHHQQHHHCYCVVAARATATVGPGRLRGFVGVGSQPARGRASGNRDDSSGTAGSRDTIAPRHRRDCNYCWCYYLHCCARRGPVRVGRITNECSKKRGKNITNEVYRSNQSNVNRTCKAHQHKKIHVKTPKSSKPLASGGGGGPVALPILQRCDFTGHTDPTVVARPRYNKTSHILTSDPISRHEKNEDTS